MSKFIYLTSKTFSNIIRRPLSLTASLLSLVLLFFMIYVIWITCLTGLSYFNNLISEVTMEVFLEDDLSEEETANIVTNFQGRVGITSASYISKEAARKKLFALMGDDLLENLDDNPLPRSIILDFDSDNINSVFLSSLVDDFIDIDGISEIYYPNFWLEKGEHSRTIIINAAIFLSIAVSLAVIFNLLHIIRLSTRYYQEEITQMRLLGAGKTFLSIPYLFEGIFYGLVSSAVAWIAIFLISGHITFKDISVIMPVEREMIYFCLIASLVGALVGLLSVRRILAKI